MKKLLLLASLLASPCFAQNTLIHCGNLIDGLSNEVKTQMTIVVQGTKITAVEKGFRKPSGTDKVIDLSKKTVMPGLIDMHVHLEGETRRGAVADRFTMNVPDVAFQSTVYAKKTLMAGFTTVRDCGGSGVNTSLRNAVARGLVVGPRIFSAGKSLATTGGHADPTNGYRKDLMGDPGPEDGVVNSAEDGRKAVRQRYKDGSDFIKITATGGVLSQAKDGQGPQFTVEEVKAIVETAKDYGYHVAAHAHGAEGAKRAILGGVTTIEHGTMLDDECMDLMKQKGTYLVVPLLQAKYRLIQQGYLVIIQPLLRPKPWP